MKAWRKEGKRNASRSGILLRDLYMKREKEMDCWVFTVHG